MSPYADELAHARLEALRQLIDAMREAEDPAEKRRCAVAIFNAPDPTDLDDQIELEDDDESSDAHTPGGSDAVGGASESPGNTAAVTPHPTSSVPSVASVRSSPPSAASDLDEDPDDAHPDDDPDDPRRGLTDEQIIAKGAAILKALHASVHSR